MDKLTAAMWRYLTGPLIVFNGSWGDTLPDWLRAAIPEARLRQLQAEKHGQEPAVCCSLEEVLVYLYTASLTQPLNADWSRIYLLTSRQVLQRHGREIPENDDPWLQGELNAWQQAELEKLRKEIRKQVEKKQARR